MKAMKAATAPKDKKGARTAKAKAKSKVNARSRASPAPDASGGSVAKSRTPIAKDLKRTAATVAGAKFPVVVCVRSSVFAT